MIIMLILMIIVNIISLSLSLYIYIYIGKPKVPRTQCLQGENLKIFSH